MTEYLSQMTMNMFQFVVVTIRSFPHSWLVTGSWSESYTTGVTDGVGTVYPTGAPFF